MRVHRWFTVTGAGPEAAKNSLLEKNAMLKTIALLGLGSAVAFTTLPAIAQTKDTPDNN